MVSGWESVAAPVTVDVPTGREVLITAQVDCELPANGGVMYRIKVDGHQCEAIYCTSTGRPYSATGSVQTIRRGGGVPMVVELEGARIGATTHLGARPIDCEVA